MKLYFLGKIFTREMKIIFISLYVIKKNGFAKGEKFNPAGKSLAISVDGIKISSFFCSGVFLNGEMFSKKNISKNVNVNVGDGIK